MGAALTLGIWFVTVMPSRGMRTAGSDAIEFALLILLILMLPFAVLIQRLLGGESSSLLWWSVPALAILALALPFPRGAQTYSNIFFTTLLLFIGLSIELLRCKRQAQEVAGRSIS